MQKATGFFPHIKIKLSYKTFFFKQRNEFAWRNQSVSVINPADKSFGASYTVADNIPFWLKKKLKLFLAERTFKVIQKFLFFFPVHVKGNIFGLIVFYLFNCKQGSGTNSFKRQGRINFMINTEFYPDTFYRRLFKKACKKTVKKVFRKFFCFPAANCKNIAVNSSAKDKLIISNIFHQLCNKAQKSVSGLRTIHFFQNFKT